MEKEKPTYYAILPADVRYDNDLTPNAKLLYAEITVLTQSNGVCWASDNYFMELYNVKRQSIQRWLKSLEDKRYIKREVVYKNNSNEIEKRYIRVYTEKIQGYTQYCDKGIHNNDTVNNTSINNTSINSIYVFKKPTIDEIESYCKERNNDVNANRFYDFYESKGWMVGKNKMKDWKASVRTWENTKKDDNVPEWFDKKTEIVEISEKEQQELNDMLQEFK